MNIQSKRKNSVTREQSDKLFEIVIQPYLTKSVNTIPRDFGVCLVLDKKTGITRVISSDTRDLTTYYIMSYGELLHQARAFSIQSADLQKSDFNQYTGEIKATTLEQLKKYFFHNVKLYLKGTLERTKGNKGL